MISEKLRNEILKRDNYTCQLCLTTKEEEFLITHHVIPTRLQGLDSPNNVFTICRNKCHGIIEIGKHKRLPSETRILRIKYVNYQRAIKDAKYLETFDSIFEKLLDIRDKKEKN